MNRAISNLIFQIAFLALISSSAFAGLRIDLRPTPPVPPGGYQPGTDVQVDVFLIDTGNPQGNIPFRGVFLDFRVSPPWGGTPGTFAYLDPDGPGPLGAGDFALIDPLPIGMQWTSLPLVSWVYPLPTPNPLFQITMPNDAEVKVGHLIVDVGTQGGVLDALNDDVADPNFGARVDFGFGGVGDPVTTWRAFNGDITGGVLELPVVPEPTSCLLLAFGASALFVKRKADR